MKNLVFRTNRLIERMEGKEYRPDFIFEQYKNNGGWAGDWEGRTLLSLVFLKKASGIEPKYLKEIIEMVYKEVNDLGYFGEIYLNGEINEQQMAGNSWFLRGMCEYYQLAGERPAFELIERIVKNLYIPTTGRYSNYPVENRCNDGKEAGEIKGKLVDGWYLSSDIGCVFIALDGISHAYEILKTDALRSLILEMSDAFFSIEKIKASFQTHGTLTALRGILRFALQDNAPDLIEKVKEVFTLYTTYGMTENYGNYNWFGRPLWTEPCAVIDSFILSCQLFQVTNQKEYLDLAQNIWYNALGYAQRGNGGFGTDICCGSKAPFLRVHGYEAYWCCTMRGGEGLAKMHDFLYREAEDTVLVNFYEDSILKSRNIEFIMSSEYPYCGAVHLQVEKSYNKCKLAFYIPRNTDDFKIALNGKDIDWHNESGFAVINNKLAAGDRIDVFFNILLHTEKTLNPGSIQGYQTVRHGDLILGIATDEETDINITEIKYHGKGRYEYKGKSMVPINDMIMMDKEDSERDKRQILFRIM